MRQTTRWTVRLRLTVLYGALFLVSGAALLGFNYALVSHRLPSVFFSTTGGPGSSGVSGVIVGQGPTQLPAPSPGDVQVLAEQLRLQAQRQRDVTLRTLVVESGLALSVMAVLSMGLGWLVAGRVLRPLRRMTLTAQRLSEHNLHERLPEDGPHDELGDLATTFNAMLGRLETAFDSQRQFVANASHELRTPLTLERAILEVALADPGADADRLRAACQRVLDIGAQQEALIEALLTLARSQRGVDVRTALDLAVVVGEVVEALPPRSVAIEADLSPAVIDGDTRLVERLVSNLVDNAVLHNQDDGWMRVRTGMEGGNAVLEVVNSGPVVPADEIGRLCQPFQRMDPDRVTTNGGLGLGLSIVAAIASAHGATLEVAGPAAGGLHVRVTFRQTVQ